MIESFIVRNFKNIEEIHLPRLKRVNLIVGKNGVGKSTLLEAIALYVSGGDRYVINSLLKGRGEALNDRIEDSDSLEQNKEHLLTLFKDWREDYSRKFYILVGEPEKHFVKMRQIYIEDLKDEEDPTSAQLKLFDDEEIIQDKRNQGNISSQGVIVETLGRMSLLRYDRSYILPRGRVIQPIVRTWEINSDYNADVFDKIALSEDEKFIVKALNIINEDIDRITFVSEGYRIRNRVPMVSLKSTGKKVRLSSMGDGVNRILTIILSLLNAKGNVLLIDEFETGLHYSVQKQLWSIIFMLAEKLDVQVFITTHSSDTLHSFANTNIEGKGMLIRLEQRQEGIVPVCYEDNNEILFAAEYDIELR